MEAGSQHRQEQFLEMNSNSIQDGRTIVLNKEEIDGRFGYRLMKRGTDFLLSVIALILLSPIFLLVSCLIKFGDHGPVFYVQQRVGKNGKLFNMYKFRSMVVNADKKLGTLIEKNEVEGAMFKMKHDPRVTSIGRVLRKYSIDELPQLINVLQGNMSLVGPRPPLEREVAEYSQYDKQRLMVTPGCSGLWQVSGRNDLSFQEMVELDIEYIQRSNWFYDLWIMIRTIFVMILPNSAY